MVKEEVKVILKTILGDSAYNNSMIVPKDISKLVRSVDYLTIQLQMVKHWCDDDGKKHIDEIINNLVGILKK